MNGVSDPVRLSTAGQSSQGAVSSGEDKTRVRAWGESSALRQVSLLSVTDFALRERPGK